MKTRIILSMFCLFIGCSNEPINKNKPVNQIVDTKAVEHSKITEGGNIKTLQKPIIDLDSFSITDYYYLFGFKVDLNSFKDLDYLQAYKKKTFFVQSLNYKKAFLSFQTQHTPPNWDGDAETEMFYQITYWNLRDKSRLIALCSTVRTWVSEQSDSILFYIHDKKGINSIQLNSLSWDLGKFIGQQYEPFFDKDIWEDPPILIHLPEEGKEIEVNLAFDEYMDNQNAYMVLDSLKIEPLHLKFDPTKYYQYRK